jgi:exosortase A
MEAIWSRSDTFAHGYLVAPISLWLIWRRRETVRNVPLRPSVWGYLAGLVCGFTWLLAQLASVDVVAQFALIGMLIATVWALAGTTVTKALAFPLGFLVFCVPFGEFLFPTMMDWTADFVVGALRLTGIPVYVEGRSLVIPSGHWQVVEGCSGVRYLIASVVVGSLYAYLNYRSLARCLVFAAMAVVVPVLANWLRAYGIVLLGHVSDNKLATGVDHLVYGWAFFGIVILGLFWLGARWQEPEDVVSVPHKAGIAARQRPPIGFGVWMLAAVIGTVVLSLAHPALSWLDSRGQVGRVQFAPWVSDAGWVVVDSVGLPEWSPRYHGMVAEDRSAWGKEGRVVGVYLGYYRDQQPGRELINSENKVIQSKDPVWTLAAYGHRQVALPEGDLAVLSTEIRGPRGRLLVWHWYWIGGWVTSNDYVAKAFLALAKLAGRGDDSAVVMLHTPVAEDGLAQADQALADFARDLGPALSQRLATTAGH